MALGRTIDTAAFPVGLAGSLSRSEFNGQCGPRHYTPGKNVLAPRQGGTSVDTRTLGHAGVLSLE